MNNYVVDLDKPMIGPPLRTCKSFLFIDWEDKESKANFKKWKEYSKEYKKRWQERKENKGNVR